jgi:acetamidase/formamidase
MATHHLDPTPATVVQVFDRALPAALTVAPGDTVIARSLDSSGYLERQTEPGEPRPRMFEPSKGHCLTGPIEVRGARPGDVLAVHFRALHPDPWGWTATGGTDTWLNRRLGVDEARSWLLWDVAWDATTGTGHARNQLGLGVAVAPFLGVVGLPRAVDGEVSTIPPRHDGGGNIDCRHLVAGATLYLPVTVPGAMLCVGDGHAAQGDGEVGGTAIECGMSSELVLDLVPEPVLTSVHAVTPAGRLTLGFDEDLNEATAGALGDMLTWLQHDLGVSRSQALAVASASVDLHVTQVANRTWGVHALLPDGVLAKD